MGLLTKVSPPSSLVPTSKETVGEGSQLVNFQEPIKPKRWLKRSPWILLGVGVSTLIFWALQPQPIPVELGSVEQRTLQVTVEAEGKTRVKNRFIVSAPVTGRLARINYDVGDWVQRGALLATIDPLPLSTQVEATQAKLAELRARMAGVDTERPKPAALALAQSNIRAAEATKQEVEAKILEAQAALNQAKRDRDRAQTLEQQGVISRQRREEAELTFIQHQQAVQSLNRQKEKAIADIAAAQESFAVIEAEQQDPDYLLQVYGAQIQAAEAELKNLMKDVKRTQIHAPVTGKVLKLEQESERFVQAGMPLIELGNAENLELVIDVLSSDAVQIKPGNSIILERWGGNQPLAAQVSYVEPEAFTKVSALGVDEQRVNVVGRFTSAYGPLGSDYRVDTKIVTWEEDQALTVPVSALFRCEKRWCVFVEQGGQAQQQPVDIGVRNEAFALVKSGLNLNQSVILHPAEEIQSGVRIQAQS